MNHIKDINQLEKTQLIASSKDNFSIELVESIGEELSSEIIEISKDLKKIYGPNSLLNEDNIHKYFNQKTLPFIARYNKKIIGFIIGAPLENFHNQSWVQYDNNLNNKNTLYTCAFIFEKDIYDFVKFEDLYCILSYHHMVFNENKIKKNFYKIRTLIYQCTIEKIYPFKDIFKIASIFKKRVF